MFYNARWLDVYLSRFTQADPIIPEQSQGVQAWDRYAYVNNSPLSFVDPSGHDGVPWWEAIKFLSTQLVKNHRLTADDWENAANTYLPAEQKGSNFSTVGSVGYGWGGVVMEANFVTTDDGQYQMFITQGGGLVSPGFSAGWAQGAIDGNFETPEDFEGYALQISDSASVFAAGGGDMWVGLVENSDGDLDFSGVYGADGFVGYGTPGLGGSLVLSNAVPANKLVHDNLVSTGLINTSLGRAYDRYVDKVTHFNFSGFGLFVCRAAHQCGRTIAQ